MTEDREMAAACKAVGTVHLIDTAGSNESSHNANIILIPTPSSSAEDPLNWHYRHKIVCLICVCVYTVAVGIASAASYPIFGQIIGSTDLTLSDLNEGTGYMFLLFGWGCLLWQPITLRWGKRPVFLVSILATAATQVWAPHATSKGYWIANRVIQGFFGAPIEFLCQESISDIFFHHERGRYISWYALALTGSSFAAPIIAGFIERSRGWEWVLYCAGILCAIGFFIILVFMKETSFTREELAMAERLSSAADTSAPETPIGKPDTDPGETELNAKSGEWKCFAYMRAVHSSRPIRLFADAARPLHMLRFPVVCFAGVLYGSNLIWFNVLNATASLVFGKHPYNFAPVSIGLTYFSPMVGTAIACVYTGFAGDRIGLWVARQNKGTLEAEYRLWLLTPCLLILPSGLILWGVAAASQLHWSVCVLAMGMLAFGIGCGMQVAICYCIDSYKALSAEALVAVMLVRNTMSFAIGYGVTPWITDLGLQNAFVMAGLLALLQTAAAVGFAGIGKSLRLRSAPKFASYVSRSLNGR